MRIAIVCNGRSGSTSLTYFINCCLLFENKKHSLFFEPFNYRNLDKEKKIKRIDEIVNKQTKDNTEEIQLLRCINNKKELIDIAFESNNLKVRQALAQSFIKIPLVYRIKFESLLNDKFVLLVQFLKEHNQENIYSLFFYLNF